MSVLARHRSALPQPAAEVVTDAARAVHVIDEQLVALVRFLDRPTQPTTPAEDQALRDLRRSVLSARIALRRVR